jgi:paraquat-inducible protein B
MDSAVESLRLDQIGGSLTNLLISANRVVSSPDLTNSFASLRSTLDQYRLLGEKVNDRVDPVVNGLTNALSQADRALVQTRGAMQNMRELLGSDSHLRHELTLVLDQLAEASQSVSALADFLQNHPNALLIGRKSSQQK